jgi:putative pyruvate formate lyase activating enzyme
MKGVVCRTGERAVVTSFAPHHGEEPPLRGRRGSGTIFFSWCNLRCVYCQNWEISQKGHGQEVEPEHLARMMLGLQEMRCHNINFVSPSHVVAQILEGLLLAARQGLHLPLVYNTGGYDSIESLELLEGVIDIYMPDAKYGSSEVARRYSHVRNYVEVNQAALREMHRQVGDLVLDARGVARRGLLVRHLVLPGELADTERVLRFLAHEISPRTCVNVMDQYRPVYRAHRYPQIARRISGGEFRRAIGRMREYGLWHADEPP